MVHMLNSGNNEFPCVVCGSSGTVVRSTPDPRLKCDRCGFMYNGSESKAMQENGQLPDAPPELQDPNPPTTDINRQPVSDALGSATNPSAPQGFGIPRTPSFVFLSKDRKSYEFCTRKNLKQTALSWQIHHSNYDVYELQAKKVTAKVDIA